MNYKTYKNLTEEQKEEYNFRFKDKPQLLTSGLLTNLMFLYMMLSLTLLLVFLVITDVRFLSYKSQVWQLFYFDTLLTQATVYIIIFYAFLDAVNIIFSSYNYFKWRKELNEK